MNQNDAYRLSIVIPVLNEAGMIGHLLEYLWKNSHDPRLIEVVVVDGGSTDNTVALAKAAGAKVIPSKKGRAVQMNTGAKNAQGEILYFLHADTYPPKHFDKEILAAVDDGHEAGCFRMRFDTRNPVLRFLAYLSRINHTLCRGGDQSLFVTREHFFGNQGFDEAYIIYEDSEFIRRLYENTGFIVLPKNVITSARKYRQKGWLRVQYHFSVIHVKNYLGAGPEELYSYYAKKLL